MEARRETGPQNRYRIVGVIVAVTGLVIVYLFQDVDWSFGTVSPSTAPNVYFSVKKTLRVIANDLLMVLLIHAWFNSKSITRVAWWLQIIDTFILLPLYLILKLSIEGDAEISSPILSQLHRLIVNPTIIILLIPAVYFQRVTAARQDVT